MSDLKIGKIEFGPLQCSQGGIPYNKAHLDAKDARIAELLARVDALTAKCNQRRDDLKQARDILDERFKTIETLQARIDALEGLHYAAKAWRSTYGCSNEYNEQLLEALDKLEALKGADDE